MFSDITEQELTEWTKELEEHSGKTFMPINKDVWISGYWLGRELRKLGCDEELCEKICFACGQRQAYADDVCEVAKIALENYKNNEWEEPGPELGTKLIKEKFGEHPDPFEILNYMSAKYGLTLEEMFEKAKSLGGEYGL